MFDDEKREELNYIDKNVPILYKYYSSGEF